MEIAFEDEPLAPVRLPGAPIRIMLPMLARNRASGNLARAETGRPLDFVYLASLGPDARGALEHPLVQKDWGGMEMLVESWDAKDAELHTGDWRSRRGLHAALTPAK